MGIMNDFELKDESVYPEDEVLRSHLGDSYDSYCRLLELFAIYDLIYEWRYYHDVKKWLCKVQKGKRTIIWMCAKKAVRSATKKS